MTAAPLSTASSRLVAALRRHWRLWFVAVLAFPVLYHVAMLLALVLRFGALPNYFELYDWPGNVAEIIRATPSVIDILAIVPNEWLLEVGRMNYDFGNGISEWSMSLKPTNFLVVMLAGALIAGNAILLLPAERRCSVGEAGGTGVATGLGAGLVGLSSLTMSWVVCCATPSWIVGLAMLGMSVATANWMESFGPWLNALGFGLLAACLVWQLTRADPADDPAPVGGDLTGRNPSPQIG